jgi:8-amino-7-oxononanoate synthase
MSQSQLDKLYSSGLLGINIKKVFRDGRTFNDGQHDWVDFCSTNYLGFDQDELLHTMGCDFSRQWGPIAGWSRLEADFDIYKDLEERICSFIGCPEVYLCHSITATNFSIIPNIAKNGIMFTDHKVHTVVWEAARLARDHGASIARFQHQDLNHLEDLLKKHRKTSPKLILVDGVYSISSEHAPIREMQDLCEKYQAWLYIDDAHGFGLLGRNPTPENPYGFGGRGIVDYYSGNYNRTFYVSSFGKAFCTATAFAVIPKEYPENVPVHALTNIFSAPLSPYTVGTVIASLKLNATVGDARRQTILDNSRFFINTCNRLGLPCENHLNQPIMFLKIGSIEDLTNTATSLKKAGILAGLRPYPVVPPNECGLRFAISALHTKEQITRSLSILAEALSEQGILPMSIAA